MRASPLPSDRARAPAGRRHAREFATKLLSGRPLGITKVHGQEHEVSFGGTTVILFPLYHPAAALYTPSMLRALEEDFARLPALLGRPPVEPVPVPVCVRPAGRVARAAGARRRDRSARPLLRTCSSSSPGRRSRRKLRRPACRAPPAWRRRPPARRAGAGKTTFVRGACRALGIEGPVTSPTFTIGHLYRGAVAVAHLDLYRFGGVSPAEWGDLEPYFDDTVASSNGPTPDARRCRLRGHPCCSST